MSGVWTDLTEAEAQIASLQAQVAELNQWVTEQREVLDKMLVRLQTGADLRVKAEAELAAALDRLEALEKMRDRSESVYEASIGCDCKACCLAVALGEELDILFAGDYHRSTSGSTVDKKGTGSKPIPHTTPGTKYGSGRPE